MLEPLGEIGHDAQVLVERHQVAEDQLRRLAATLVGADARIEVVRAAVTPTTRMFGFGGRAGAGSRRRQGSAATPGAGFSLLDRPVGMSLSSFFSSASSGQRFDRRHPVDVERGEPLAQRRSSGCRRLKQPELPLRLGRRAADRRPAAARQLVALERRQNLARAIDDGGGRPASRATWMP